MYADEEEEIWKEFSEGILDILNKNPTDRDEYNKTSLIMQPVHVSTKEFLEER